MRCFQHVQKIRAVTQCNENPKKIFARYEVTILDGLDGLNRDACALGKLNLAPCESATLAPNPACDFVWEFVD